MALSTKKKNIIIADWKTGAFTKKSLEKKHKISFKTLDKIVSGISASNADVVDVLHEAKMVENSIKNPVELKAIENVVNDRLKINNISNKLLDKIDKFIDNNKAQKVITEGQGMGASMARVVEHDLQSSDFKNIADTIHKAGITLGVVDTKPDVAIQNNNNQSNTTNEIVGYGVKTIESK